MLPEKSFYFRVHSSKIYKRAFFNQIRDPIILYVNTSSIQLYIPYFLKFLLSIHPENPDPVFLPCFGGVGGGFYSYLRASTGFLVAAFQLCQLTVSNAMPNVSNPAKAKIHHAMVALFPKPSNKLDMIVHPIGQAITNARTTQRRKVRFKRYITSKILAPFTFRMPISFVLDCVA